MIGLSLFPNRIEKESIKLKELLNFFGLLCYIYIITDPIGTLLGISSHEQSFGDFDMSGILRILIIAPLIEEIFFRIHLSGQKNHAWGGVLMLIPLSLMFNLGWLIIILLLFGGFIILFYDKFSEFISEKYFNQVFFISSFLFALAHFHQIDAETIFGRFLIIIIAYLPMGIYFGYVRKKYGLAIVICIHSFFNFTVLIINSLIY